MHHPSNRLESRIGTRWIEDAASSEPVSHQRTTAAKMALILLIFTASIARIALLDVPFARNHESTASGPMVCAARNLVRYGMVSQRFCGVLNTGRVPQNQWVWYAHHPPLVVMAIAWSSEMFGKSEWCYRLPSAVFSVLGTAMIFVLVNRRFGWQTALAAGVIHAFSPFAWMFANMPDVVGPQMVFFSLFSLYSYFRWRETDLPGWLMITCASFVLAVGSDWSAFFLAPVLAFHYVALRPPRQWFFAGLRVIPFALASALLLGGLFAWLLSTPDKTVFSQMHHRIDGDVPTSDQKQVTFGLWWKLGIEYYYANTQTRLVLALIAGYGVTMLVLAARRRWHSLARHDITLMLTVWGLMHLLIGMQSSAQHMWVWCVLIPGTSMAAAVMLRWIWLAVPRFLRNSSMAPYAVAMIAMTFIGYSYLRANQLIELGLPMGENCGYSLVDFGKFLNRISKPDEGIITTDTSDPAKGDSQPALWFYADRQLRTGIRSPEQLEVALLPGPYRLYYDYVQPDGPKPTWFIMPAAHYIRFPELTAVLDARFERWIVQDYVVYFLPKPAKPEQLKSTPKAPTPAPAMPGPGIEMPRFDDLTRLETPATQPAEVDATHASMGLTPESR